MASCLMEMVPYHLRWAPCCFNGQSNIGHDLFWIDHKFYLIRSLGETQVGRVQLLPLDLDQDVRADASGFTEASFRPMLGEAGPEPSLENKWLKSPSVPWCTVTHGSPVGDVIYDTMWRGERGELVDAWDPEGKPWCQSSEGQRRVHVEMIGDRLLILRSSLSSQ